MTHVLEHFAPDRFTCARQLRRRRSCNVRVMSWMTRSAGPKRIGRCELVTSWHDILLTSEMVQEIRSLENTLVRDS